MSKDAPTYFYFFLANITNNSSAHTYSAFQTGTKFPSVVLVYNIVLCLRRALISFLEGILLEYPDSNINS
jgi:hypothetical protein